MQAAPDTPLLYVLRNDLDLHAPRFGCGLAQCGACTVHLDGEAVRSCILPVGAARGKQVTTLEALASEKNPHPVVTAFIEEDAASAATASRHGHAVGRILKHNPRPTEAQIKKALNANICRCGTHYRIVRAVTRASRAMA